MWSSRKGAELPLLMIVTNNRYGISTPYAGQHGDDQIADRGKAFGMPTAVVDGNDPEASYAAIEKAMRLRAHRAQAVPARGDGVAPARPLVGERRERRRRTRSTASSAFERTLEDAQAHDARRRSTQLREKYTQRARARRAKRVRGEPRADAGARSGTTCSPTRTYVGGES